MCFKCNMINDIFLFHKLLCYLLLTYANLYSEKNKFFMPFAKYTEESNYFKLANIKHNQPHKILIILNILFIASIKTFFLSSKHILFELVNKQQMTQYKSIKIEIKT